MKLFFLQKQQKKQLSNLPNDRSLLAMPRPILADITSVTISSRTLCCGTAALQGWREETEWD